MRHRTLVIIFLIIAAAQVVHSAKNPHRRQYVKHALGKGATRDVVTGAVGQHIRNSPHEWGRGAAGFSKRLGSGFAQHGVKTAIEYPIASFRHEELGYQRKGTGGFGPRLKHALVSTVVTRKKTTGRRTVAAGRVSGTVGSSFISRLWYPARYHTVASGAGSSGVALGVEAGKNTVQEFWPQIRHPHRH